jgi:hypothetical protein
MGWVFAIIIFLAVLALIVYPPLIFLAVVIGIGATIHYFATETNPTHKTFSLVLLLVTIAIIGGMYAWLGGVGVVIGIVAIGHSWARLHDEVRVRFRTADMTSA